MHWAHGVHCLACGVSMQGSCPLDSAGRGEPQKLVRELVERNTPQHAARAKITARYLILVSRGRDDLFEYLRQKFLTEIGVEVRYDRRSADRRQRESVKPLDRRRRDRRTRVAVDAELQRFGFAIVTRK